MSTYVQIHVPDGWVEGNIKVQSFHPDNDWQRNAVAIVVMTPNDFSHLYLPMNAARHLADQLTKICDEYYSKGSAQTNEVR